MVTLSQVQSSNLRISSALPPKLVAIFVGATSGIGETTLKQFAKHSLQPRAYFVGRSQDAGDRITAECKALNPEGEYIFVKADVSLIRVVDEVCEEIKAKEKAVNILFLSAGLPIMDRRGIDDQVFPLATQAENSILTISDRNIRASPLADRLEFLFAPPLHHQSPPASPARYRPPPCRYRRRRRQ